MPTAMQRSTDPNAPATRRARRLRKDEKPDQLADRAKAAEDRQEALIDEALEESFPSSDPIAPKRIT